MTAVGLHFRVLYFIILSSGFPAYISFFLNHFQSVWTARRVRLFEFVSQTTPQTSQQQKVKSDQPTAGSYPVQPYYSPLFQITEAMDPSTAAADAMDDFVEIMRETRTEV